VTEADLAVNHFLLNTLRQARPDYGWLSEETEDSTARLDHDRVFIIDPIDGTRSVVYLPMRDKLYAAARGLGATLNGEPMRVSDTSDLAQATLLAAKPAQLGSHWAAGKAPEYKRSYRPSLAYRLSLVGQGRMDGMLTLRPSWEWDIAAGALIVTEAGGQISDRTGAPLLFNNADPRFDGVVAANAPVHAALCSALV